MSEVLPIGCLLATDGNGYFTRPCSKELIVSPWREVVDEINEAYRSHLGSSLHSAYVRGSVARGTAIAGISDIDTFAVISTSRWKIDLSWAGEVQRRLDEKYPFQTGVELQFVTCQEVRDPANSTSIGFVMKHLSACTWGVDLAEQLAPYKPGRYLVEGIHSVETSIKQFRSACRRPLDQDQTRKLCQWLMKKIVRTGFLLVTERERSFTRDLYPSYAAFATHYPEQARFMRTALEWSIDPVDDIAELTNFVDGFGKWIVAAVFEMYPMDKGVHS